mgnify:CR=1 FL=1
MPYNVFYRSVTRVLYTNVAYRCACRWCSIDYVTAVKQMLVLVVEGVSWLDVTISQPAAWAHTNNLLSDYVSTISPIRHVDAQSCLLIIF